MKKQSQTTTVYRIDLEKGNYTTISRNILISKELTDSAKTLLQLCLNNTNEWKLVLTHYQKLLNWSNDKMSGAVSNLIEYGYLKKEKYPNGKGKGFTYIYTVSEFGNLNPNREKVTQNEIDESFDTINDVDDTQLEVIVLDSTYEMADTSTRELTDLELGLVTEIITEVMNMFHISDVYLNKLLGHYTDEFSSGKLNITKWNKQNQICSILKSIEKNKNSNLKIIEKWIDFHNDRGTKDQRINIKERALIYFKEINSTLEEVMESHVVNKLMKLKMSIVDANRIFDRRYQD